MQKLNLKNIFFYHFRNLRLNNDHGPKFDKNKLTIARLKKTQV